MRVRYVVGIAGLVMLLAAGCNVFEGFYREGESNDPDVLIEDAEAALQRGDAAHAVQYLRRALEDAPAHDGVRLKLAGALLQERGVDVMDVVRLARTLTETFETTAAGKTLADTCNFDPATDRVDDSFDPTDVDNYDKLLDSEEALAEARTLVDAVLAADGSGPATFTDDDLDAAVERLRADGRSDHEIAEALLVDAVAYLTLAYLDVASAGGDAFTFYHVTAQPSGRRFIGFCAPDAGVLDGTLQGIACHVDDFRLGALLLDRRAALLGTDTARDVADLVADGYDLLRESLDDAGIACPFRLAP